MGFNVGATKSTNYNSPAAAQTTAAITTTGGSGSVFLVYVYHYDSDTGFTITDTYSNTWTSVGTVNNGQNNSQVFKCEGGTGGASHTFTVTCVNAGFGTGISVVELTGMATSAAVDKFAGAFDNASPYSSGATATTAQAGEMLVGFCRTDAEANGLVHVVDSTSTPTSGWTIRTENTEAGGPNREISMFAATAVVSSTGTYNFATTCTGSAEAHVAIVTVKEGTGGASAPKRALLMGVG